MTRKPSSEPWDSPRRTRRLDENDQPISDDEFEQWDWFDITSLYDPDDVRRLTRLCKRGQHAHRDGPYR